MSCIIQTSTVNIIEFSASDSCRQNSSSDRESTIVDNEEVQTVSGFVPQEPGMS